MGKREREVREGESRGKTRGGRVSWEDRRMGGVGWERERASGERERVTMKRWPSK